MPTPNFCQYFSEMPPPHPKFLINACSRTFQVTGESGVRGFLLDISDDQAWADRFYKTHECEIEGKL